MSSNALCYSAIIVDPELGWTASAEEIPAIPELAPVSLFIHKPECVVLVYK